MTKEPEKDDLGMLFERTMYLYFGDKAHQSAGHFGSAGGRRSWIVKALRKALKALDKLDTSVRHKDLLMTSGASALKSVGDARGPSWPLVLHLLRVIGFLLGFEPRTGLQARSLLYWQSRAQYYMEASDALQEHYDRRSIIARRRELVHELKSKGDTTFMIGMFLNMSEYEVRKLLRAQG